jgi:hypothetical protein
MLYAFVEMIRRSEAVFVVRIVLRRVQSVVKYSWIPLMVFVVHAVALSCCHVTSAMVRSAKSPVDAEVAAEGVIPADENLLSVGFPKISVLVFRGSSEPEFRCGCWIL